jgi:hypothetical protein
MSLSRRSLFKAAAAAPVAAKQIAADVYTGHGLARLSDASNTLGYGYAPSLYGESTPANPDWIDHLSKEAAGEFSDDTIAMFRQSSHIQAEASQANINALRSVSPAVRYQMLLARDVQRRKRDAMADAIRMLASMGRIG